MELIMLALFVFVGAISGQTMMPVCRCSQLNSCMQQEMQRMQTCAMSTQCMSLLGGNRNQVSSCLTQKMQRGQSMDDCLKMKLANMGCTNSTNPMQVRSNMMNMMNQQSMMTDRSAIGQFSTCVHNCMMGSSASGSQQSMMNRDCMQQLGCQLDMSMFDINAIVMSAQSCSMMAPMPMMMNNQQPMMMNNNNNMMTNQQQNSMMMPMSSPAMMWLMPQDCQCLMNAGVQISCNNMMMNNNNMMMNNNNNMMMNNRGRRSSSE